MTRDCRTSQLAAAPKRGWRNVLKMGALTAAVTALSAVAAPGCLDRPLEPIEPRPTSTIVERLTQSSVKKIDLLLVIDNSGSMADKQNILQLAVPDLVGQLVNPKCVDDAGQPSAQQPTGPLEACPEPGSQREFEPVVDIHIGIITSSLGGHGSDTCTGSSNGSENDFAHLIVRESTAANAASVPTWQDKGFLVWDPSTDAPSHTPQGETNQATLIDNVKKMVGGAGEVGCGFEATLESWYRFLVDPDPFEKVTLKKDVAVLSGTDKVLLAQRADFLRPDSLLAIIMLSDENDCSIRDGGQFYFAAQTYKPNTSQLYHLPKPRAACLTDPNDKCCRSCGQAPAPGCDDSKDACGGGLSSLEDHLNLRCFDQKRRFGIDFLQPISRYVSALRDSTITDRNGNPQPNPLFDDLVPGDENSTIRDPGLVFVAGIVGVPWQDIARRDADGVPNLLAGENGAGKPVGGFQTSGEMLANGTWDIILGQPQEYVAPTDPLMIEAVDPRMGSNPVTNDPIVAPTTGPNTNPINGHEYSNPDRSDLQYSCIFPLSGAGRDCSQTNGGCDCKKKGNDNPLCVDNPADGGERTLQKYAKAYPGVRELSVLKGAGSQGIVGSICPAQTTNAQTFDFGYRPAIGAIVERLKQALGGQCLSRSLKPKDGQVSCLILEASKSDMCDCTVAGRKAISSDAPAVLAALDDPLAQQAGWNCFCELTQTTGDDLKACQQQVSDNPVNSNNEAVHGWCYVDATTVPPTGNSAIVENCPPTEKRIVRFVGDGAGRPGSTLFITCSGDSAG